MTNQAPPSTAHGFVTPPEITRTIFDEAYGELFSAPEERFEVEVLAPLPTDVVRLFFELADEALLNPARDNPFAQEKRVFELSSETLAQELTRLQSLSEAALLSFNRPIGSASAGQLPTMLATMYVGATRVKPAPFIARLKAGIVDGAIIATFSVVIALFIAWFTAQDLRPAILGLDPIGLLALSGLAFALILPVGISYYLRPGRTLGYRRESLEIVNAQSGNPVSVKTTRLRAWLTPLAIPSVVFTTSGRSIVDLATGSTVRRNYALNSGPVKSSAK